MQCLCHIGLAMPLLHNGMSTEGTDGIWIRQLQHMLIDMGLATQDSASGSYDAQHGCRDPRLPAEQPPQCHR